MLGFASRHLQVFSGDDTNTTNTVSQLGSCLSGPGGKHGQTRIWGTTHVCSLFASQEAKRIRVKASKDAESTLTPARTRQTVINGLLLSLCCTTSAARGGFSTSRKQYGLFGPLHNGQSH